MSNPHKCQQQKQIANFLIFSGKINEAVKTMKKDIDALFDKSREILEIVTALDKKTSIENKELKIKYGFFGSLITIISTILGALAVYFFRK